MLQILLQMQFVSAVGQLPLIPEVHSHFLSELVARFFPVSLTNYSPLKAPQGAIHNSAFTERMILSASWPLNSLLSRQTKIIAPTVEGFAIVSPLTRNLLIKATAG